MADENLIENPVENTIEFELPDREATATEAASITLDDARNMIASEREKWEAESEARFRQLTAPEAAQPKETEDLQSLWFDDPAKAAQIIEDRAYQRAMQTLAPQMSNLSRSVVSQQLNAGVDEAARPYIEEFIQKTSPMDLAQLNNEGVEMIQDIALGKAYRAGKLTPRQPQVGAPVGGGRDVVQLLGGYNQEDIAGIESMIGRKATREDLKKWGVSR